MIHPTAIIGSDVEISENVSVGPYTVIGGKTKIGAGTRIDTHVLIEGNTTIGEQCNIFHGAAIGCIPQDLKYNREKSYVQIGNRNTIREFVTINLATGAGGTTRIGNDNLLMSYVHIAHNCEIGNQTILANAVNLAGHVTIEDYAIIGGMTPVHQFVRIGRDCMIGGASRIAQDVLPYTLVAGNPLAVSGLNTVGLHRRGFSGDSISRLKQAYKIIYRSDLNLSQALERLKTTLERVPEIDYLIRFIENSERGISK